jgi:hypothetical protein
MAIRKKEDKAKPRVPAAIEAKVDLALQSRYMAEWFSGKSAGMVREAMDLIANDDNVELVIGEGFRTKNGMIIVSEQKSRMESVDVEAIEKAVADGKLSIADLIAGVSTWNKTKVKEMLPTAIVTAEGEPNTVTSLRIDPKYKAVLESKSETMETIWADMLSRVAA